MKWIVTLPPRLSADAQAEFATAAWQTGANLLELRSDLYRAGEIDVSGLARILPLLVAERGAEIPAHWEAIAAVIDRPLDGGRSATLHSLHSAETLTPEQALGAWSQAPIGAHIKHVEPLGELADAARLFRTQALLADRFGAGRITVLATGPLALPFRAALAVRNAFDYVALNSSWSAAAGQRLLQDAVRTGRSEQSSRPKEGRSRRGILGTHIAHSRSPRIHLQPFDRIDIPEETDLGPLLEALRPLFAGLAVTSPFKLRAASAIGVPLLAVNTLVRRSSGWEGFNTDVEGARAVLERLKASRVTVLGAGGATAALRIAAEALGIELAIMRRSGTRDAASREIVWTWPADLEPPTELRLDGKRVAILAYGAPGRQIAKVVRALGGEPLRFGPCWFAAQARAQRELWSE